jgi:hypothetical protein
MSVTKQETAAALQILLAVAEVIRELGEVPSGVLYAQLLGRVNIEGYQALLRQLKGAGLVEEKNHLLRWVGPTFEKES